ncbi:ER membrane protein complex subunit 8/9 homolog [Amaranthus tricolor]|uniref:ER membrane protein complex subunit 8/9 homolog n=1 Tax=Amaranthus tricolor TaxID=29722 RepID=UPI00258A4CDC|nr:ER membrane protein complex subunit 8/9 homolog [Amaranthus tricolor]XP_057523658.1 ER membrane protein complex subunit 8/9 homolog [Amaranthus tricolor]
MGELTYEIGQNAYIKIVLHALKHKSSAVNGVLVGRYDAGKGIVQISDAVPLFHSNTGLLPSLEIALMQIEEHFASQEVSLVGYFHANERSDDYDLSNVAKNIGDHLCRYFPQAGILLLDNRKLEALPKVKDRSPVMQLYSRDGSKWKVEENSHLVMKEPSANMILLDYVSTQKWEGIIDFDDHLDDISKDWLNAELFK